VAVAAARSIGCSVVNIGGQDISEGREHLILGLIRQIVQLGLLRKVDLNWHPELFRLCEPGESLDALRKMPADQVLLRWINYQLAASGTNRR
jgi:plastin-1